MLYLYAEQNVNLSFNNNSFKEDTNFEHWQSEKMIHLCARLVGGASKASTMKKKDI